MSQTGLKPLASVVSREGIVPVGRAEGRNRLPDSSR
jgi:hypothetical protein